MKIFQFIIIAFYFLLNSYTYAHKLEKPNYFDKFVQDLLQEKMQDDRVEIEIEYNSKSMSDNIRINQDNIRAITLEKFDPDTSSFLVNIEYINDNSELLSGKYTSYIELPVSSRNIKIGEILQLSDLNNLKVKLENINNADIIGTAEIVGMQTKKNISKDSIIKKSELAWPSIIKNNDPVNIIYSSGAINLKTTGVAQGTGAIGDMIKVKNGHSGAILLGRIINKNTVQIDNDN